MFSVRAWIKLVLPLLMTISASFAFTAAAGNGSASSQTGPSDRQILALQGRVGKLLAQLDDMEKPENEPSRGKVIRRHWRAMQDYMRQVRNLQTATPDGTPSLQLLYGSAAGCALAPEMNDERYIARARDLLWTMREQLADMYQKPEPLERQRLLLEHARSSYQGLQIMRGIGWTEGKATPSAEKPYPFPNGDTVPAYLVVQYCGQCHAPPPPELHSPAEWTHVASKMVAHMGLAVSDNPNAVQVPSARQLSLIVGYLKDHGCEVSQ